MSLGPSGRPREPLHIVAMALALLMAAFAGGALGLIWHKLTGEEKTVETTTANLTG